MSSCIVVTFIKMQPSLNVDVLFIGRLHQISHKVCGFGRIVDVVYQVSYSINNHKTKVGTVVDGIANQRSPLIGVCGGSEMTKLGCSGSWSKGSPAKDKMRCITSW